MADYKILQNIDLAQNEIKEVSKIANDRQDGKDKGLLIQTGNDTSLAFNRKIDTSNTINSIKGTVKDGTDEDKKESALNLEPSKVIIANTKGDKTSTESKIIVGLTTLDSEGKEHIEAVSPSIDIKTGDTDYTDPHISLKKDARNSNLGLQSNTVEIKSGEETANSSLKMDGGITGVSNNISLKDSSKKSSEKVSLTLNSDGTNGTISESASKSITETVDKLSLTLEKTDSLQSITLKNEKEPNNSKIEVLDSKVKISKGSDSYINIESGTQSDFIEEQSNKVIIKTPSNNVTLTLNESDNSASLESNKGKITLTSQGDATTEYGNNAITTGADTIIIKAKGYDKADTKTKYYPHIKLESNASTPTNSILLEGKTIDISSEKDGSNIEDTITLSGTKLNIESTTTEITSNNINIKKGNDNVLILNTSAPSISIPSSTVTDIDSKTIGLGDKGNNSTTTISGSEFHVTTTYTNITSPTTTVSGTTTIQSSPNSENTIVVDTGSTSITGNKAIINSDTVEIGTVDTTVIKVGRKATDTTTLQSNTTGITSPTLNISSPKVDFNGKNQKVIFEGTSEGTDNSSVTSKVPTYIKDTTFSVDKTTDSSIVFKVDTSNKSTTINGNTSTIESTDVNIGTTTTTTINVGRNATGTITTLQSNTTNITSPEINIGTSDSSTSVSIGKDSSTVSLKGKSNFLIEAKDADSKVQANDLKFNTSLSSNDIKVYWDSTLNSLVFAKA